MLVREVRIDEKDRYNVLVKHPVQSWEWGEFKKKTGVDVERLALFERNKMRYAYQISFHPIPKTNLTIGYFPKGPIPDEQMLMALSDLGRRKRAVFIKLEPDVLKKEGQDVVLKLKKSFAIRQGNTIFTPYTFILDLSKSEEELLAQMKSKTRYNVRLAARNDVRVAEDNSIKAFEMYLKLTRKTSRRQGFYAHDEEYHRLMWEFLQPAGIAHLLAATWKGKYLVTWVVFIFDGKLFYPYGASSTEQRNLMASNLMMWEAMRFGKSMGCKTFDLWGSLGPNPDKSDPWYGFHRFKEGYGGELVEFVGSYDLVIRPKLYSLVQLADKVRWKALRLMSRFR